MFVFTAIISVVAVGFMHCQGWVRGVLDRPLRDLYFRGPRVQGYGFWNGLPLPDICAQLTHTPSEVWVTNAAQCITMTDRYFDAFYIGCTTLLYIWVLYSLCSHWSQLSLLDHQYRLFCKALLQQHNSSALQTIKKN